MTRIEKETLSKFGELPDYLKEAFGLKRLSVDGCIFGDKIHIESPNGAKRFDLMFRFIDHRLVIGRIFFGKKYQRQGIASKILEILKQNALHNGFTQIELEAMQGDKIRCFALKHGFEIKGRDAILEL